MSKIVIVLVFEKHKFFVVILITGMVKDPLWSKLKSEKM